MIYVQADPIGLDGGPNPYVYADNAPTMMVDPEGLKGERPPSIIPGGPYPPNAFPPSPFPPPWQPNGNMNPGYTDQDWKCSFPAGFFNTDKCSKQCCIKHDACYQKNGCNASSWVGNKFGLGLACQKCNDDAVRCIKENYGKKDCGPDCQ